MKYIVYITKNLVNNINYIGVHKTKDPEVFDGYIGCGVYVNKPSSYNNPVTPFQYAVKKYGPKQFVRSIIKIFDTEQEAYQLEKELVTIDVINSKSYYNVCLGGKIPAKVYKTVYQYQINGELLKSWKIEDACNFYNINYNTLLVAISTRAKCSNFYWSYDKINKLDCKLFGQRNDPKFVYKYSKDGNCIGMYDSINKTPGDNAGIYNAIITKRLYLDNYYSFSLYETFIPNKFNLKNSLIYVYDLNKNYVCEGIGLKNLTEKLNIEYKSQIGVCVKSKKSYKGYYFILDKNDLNDVTETKDFTKKLIDVYDIYGNYIITYNGVNETCKQLGINTGSAHRVLKGSAKQVKGYVLKYKDI